MTIDLHQCQTCRKTTAVGGKKKVWSKFQYLAAVIYTTQYNNSDPKLNATVV